MKLSPCEQPSSGKRLVPSTNMRFGMSSSNLAASTQTGHSSATNMSSENSQETRSCTPVWPVLALTSLQGSASSTVHPRTMGARVLQSGSQALARENACKKDENGSNNSGNDVHVDRSDADRDGCMPFGLESQTALGPALLFTRCHTCHRSHHGSASCLVCEMVSMERALCLCEERSSDRWANVPSPSCCKRSSVKFLRAVISLLGENRDALQGNLQLKICMVPSLTLTESSVISWRLLCP
jgi:hypothetical protein